MCIRDRFWGDHKAQLLAAKVTLHCVAPLVLFDIQQIGKDMDIHALTSLFQQAPLQIASGMFQIFRVCLVSGTQLFQFVFYLLFPVFQVPDLCGGFLALLFRVSAQVGDGFLQAAKGLIVNGAVFKFLNIPKGLVWGDILVFPGLKGQGGLLPSCLLYTSRWRPGISAPLRPGC